MKRIVTQTFEFDKNDIEALIKKELITQLGGNTQGIQITIHIENEPGYDGTGIPPQILTKITARYNQ